MTISGCAGGTKPTRTPCSRPTRPLRALRGVDAVERSTMASVAGAWCLRKESTRGRSTPGSLTFAWTSGARTRRRRGERVRLPPRGGDALGVARVVAGVVGRRDAEEGSQPARERRDEGDVAPASPTSDSGVPTTKDPRKRRRPRAILPRRTRRGRPNAAAARDATRARRGGDARGGAAARPPRVRRGIAPLHRFKSSSVLTSWRDSRDSSTFHRVASSPARGSTGSPRSSFPGAHARAPEIAHDARRCPAAMSPDVRADAASVPPPAPSRWTRATDIVRSPRRARVLHRARRPPRRSRRQARESPPTWRPSGATAAPSTAPPPTPSSAPSGEPSSLDMISYRQQVQPLQHGEGDVLSDDHADPAWVAARLCLVDA